MAAALRWLPEPEPTTRLVIDDPVPLGPLGPRRCAVDPWLISFVVCSRDGPGSLLGVFLNVEAVGVAVFWSGGGL